MMKHLKVSTQQNVLTVRLNRPEKRNAFFPEMIAEITEVFQQTQADPSLRAVVLTAEGKSFCAGGDLQWMQSMANFTLEQNLADAEELYAMFWAIRTCPVPVIARVFGHCFGGGLGLAAACDIAAAESATEFSFSEVKWGLVPAVISPFVIERTQAVRTNEWFMTAKVFRAREAEEGGLLNFCGDLPALDQFVETTLHNILNSAPGAVRATKKLILSYSRLEWTKVRKAVTVLISERRVSAEGQAGLQAFLNKKSPQWNEPPYVAPAKI